MPAHGTIVGMLVGRLAHPLLPDTLVDEVGLAIAGMAGLFTATVRAPLTGIILVSELTGGFDMALATTLTCATASLTAAWLGGEPPVRSSSGGMSLLPGFVGLAGTPSGTQAGP